MKQVTTHYKVVLFKSDQKAHNRSTTVAQRNDKRHTVPSVIKKNNYGSKETRDPQLHTVLCDYQGRGYPPGATLCLCIP